MYGQLNPLPTPNPSGGGEWSLAPLRRRGMEFGSLPEGERKLAPFRRGMEVGSAPEEGNYIWLPSLEGLGVG